MIKTINLPLFSSIWGIIVLISFSSICHAQFSAINLSTDIITQEHNSRLFPTKFETFQYNPEYVLNKDKSSIIDIELPVGDDRKESFQLEPYALMPTKLAAKFPTFRAYRGSSLSGAQVYLDITDKGLHAVINRYNETFYIDPIGQASDETYIMYNTNDFSLDDAEMKTFECAVQNAPIMDQIIEDETLHQSNIKFRGGDPVEKRRYILALATTIEYCQFHGGTQSQAMSAMVTAINRVNSIYNVEMAVEIVLHEDTDLLIFCDGVDPYSNGDTGTMIGQNPPAIRSRIPSNTYDFGHVFCTNGGGLAQLQSICQTSKEAGVTCHFAPINDPFYVGYVCHEMGHQFGGNHIFNALNGSCMTNINSGTAYEPGSGSTIMSYAGLCSGDNTANGSSPYYNSHSLTEMHSFINRSSGGDRCGQKTTTDNTPPTIPELYSSGIVIPISTPIELNGKATDMEDENLTYNWEQHDLGPQANLGSPIDGLGPLFRSFSPSDNPNRIIPTIPNLIRNINARTEILPTVSRPLSFRFTVRDNHENGGGVTWSDVEFEVSDQAGPFLISSYNASGVELIGGDVAELTWDVANTNQSPVNCKYVNIYYSTDGGKTFPDLLAERVANNGQTLVTLPNIITDDFRFKIKGDNNIFFDINNRDIDLIERTEPGFAFNVNPSSQLICTPQSTNFNIETQSFLGFEQNITYKIISDLPEGVTSSTSGSISPGQSTGLSFDIDPFVATQQLDVAIEVIVAGVDTSIRHITLDIVSSDYRDQVLLSPEDGLKNATKSQTYNWSPSLNAESYNFELSDDILFSTIIYSAENITTNELDISDFELASSTTYYWRLIPNNRICGPGPASSTSSFRTGSESCTEFNSQDLPKVIQGATPNTITSELTILDNFIIDDLNVSSLKGVHGNIGQLSFVLISPNNTRVRLSSRKCNFQTSFDLRLDDDVLTNINCPININGIYKPSDPLSAFNGEDAQGIWLMEVDDASAGLGGSLSAWGLEFCASMSIPAPTLAKNNILILNQLETKNVDSNLLQVTDDNAGPENLVYTLSNRPLYGELLLNNQILTVGSSYTQTDINNGGIQYRHTAGHAENDFFKFEVSNPAGGWIGGVNFVIEVNEILSTKYLAEEVNIKVSPNPASDYIQVELPTDINERVQLAVYDMNGKMIQDIKTISDNQINRIETYKWPNGIYSLVFISEKFRAVKKIVISK